MIAYLLELRVHLIWIAGSNRRRPGPWFVSLTASGAPWTIRVPTYRWLDSLQPFNHLKVLGRNPEHFTLAVSEIRLAREISVQHLEASKSVSIVPDLPVLACRWHSHLNLQARWISARNFTTCRDNPLVRHLTVAPRWRDGWILLN